MFFICQLRSYLSLDGVDLELDGGLAVLDGAVPLLHLDPHLRPVREVHVVLVVLWVEAGVISRSSNIVN